MIKEEIHTICEKYGITNYTINPDGSIDVFGSVYLSGYRLTKLPLKFNKVSGYFNISYNDFTSLEGSPVEVGGNFWCNDNQLTSLKGCPKLVGGIFNCGNNNLTSLEGCPKEVGEFFYCSSNKLTSLKGGPEKVYDMFYCGGNPLESLDGYNGNYDMLDCDNKDGLMLKEKRKEKLKLIHNL